MKKVKYLVELPKKIYILRPLDRVGRKWYNRGMNNENTVYTDEFLQEHINKGYQLLDQMLEELEKQQNEIRASIQHFERVLRDRDRDRKNKMQ